jgi:hypothetical protein
LGIPVDSLLGGGISLGSPLFPNVGDGTGEGTYSRLTGVGISLDALRTKEGEGQSLWEGSKFLGIVWYAPGEEGSSLLGLEVLGISLGKLEDLFT